MTADKPEKKIQQACDKYNAAYPKNVSSLKYNETIRHEAWRDENNKCNGKNDPAVFYKESESEEWVWRSRIKGKQKGGEWTWLRRSNDQSTGIWKKSSSSVSVAGSGNHIARMSESCALLQLAPSTNFSVISRLIFTDCGKCFTHYWREYGHK